MYDKDWDAEDWNEYHEEIDAYAAKRRKAERMRERDLRDPTDPFDVVKEEFIDGQEFEKYEKNLSEKFLEKAQQKLLDYPEPKKEKDEEDDDNQWGWYTYEKSDKKTATLNTIGKIVMKQKVSEDLKLLFGLLNKERLEGLTYLFIKQDGNGAFIYDWFMPKQKVSSGSCDPEQSELAKWYVKNRNSQKVKDLKGWAHSHGNMSMFWSTDDENYTRQLTTGFDMSVPKMLFSIVYSFAGKKPKFLARFDVNSMFGRITIDNIDIEIEDNKWTKKELKNYLSKQKKIFKKLIKKQITEKTYETVVITSVDETVTKIGPDLEEKTESIDVYERERKSCVESRNIPYGFHNPMDWYDNGW